MATSIPIPAGNYFAKVVDAHERTFPFTDGTERQFYVIDWALEDTEEPIIKQFVRIPQELLEEERPWIPLRSKLHEFLEAVDREAFQTGTIQPAEWIGKRAVVTVINRNRSNGELGQFSLVEKVAPLIGGAR